MRPSTSTTPLDAPGSALPRLGALEQQVMDVLWDCPDQLCTRRVLERLATTEHAYTTIATVLTNLTRKGLVERVPGPRRWNYRPAVDRAGYAAGCMAQLLAGDGRQEALRAFVTFLGPADRATLRDALDG